jgi:hypothetical protein
MAVTLSYPKPRSCQEKLATVTFADTTAREIMKLPKYAVIEGIYIIGSAAAAGGTLSAGTLNVGSTTTATEYVAGFDVVGATGEGYHTAGAAAVGSAMCTPLTSDVSVYAKYIEVTGSGATAGSWTVKIEYYVTGPGETL